ncbi:hypothetical protein LIER_32117 [Lithospermum erythrorhizon]|uniref:UV-B-induced protein At3g17800, chloroplastic-like n=1 Tax=Lithospermum erythrorhizon TaxID=34254 RepID=A0AAV3RV62_LITER
MESATLSIKPPISLFRSSFSTPNFIPFASKSSFKYSSISYEKQRLRHVSLRNGSCTVVRASLSSSDFHDSPSSVAPLRLESPVGQFLSQILVSHPHLVPAAVEQQLEQLESDRDAEKQKEEPSATRTDLVLYRRIAEVKANERKKALEEILYALVVQKFMDANVSLIPTITPTSDSAGQVDSWGDADEKVQHLHSPEAYEMVQNHLALILGSRLADKNSVAQISKLRVGQVYAASVMYGYFLKRIDQRFQLEKTMKILPGGSSDIETIDQSSGNEIGTLGNISPKSPTPQTHREITTFSGGDLGAGGSTQGKSSRLRNYVMTFDGENLQRFATIRSKEAVGIIEKHTEALFGRPEIIITPQGMIDSSKDEQIKISFGGLRRLVLEAVTFGSFLWDAESYVDMRYHFVAN